MKVLLRAALCLSLLVVIVMGTSAYSHSEEPDIIPPDGMKLIPEDLTADFDLSLYSQYIWRGYGLSRDSLVIFPSLTIGYKGFAVNVWSDLDTRFVGSNGGRGKEFKLQETDVTVSYSHTIAPLKLNYTLGWTLYDWKQTRGRLNDPKGIIDDAKTQEVFLSLTLDTLLSPTFVVYQEIEAGQASYFQLGVSHSLPVNYKDLSLDLAASISYLDTKGFSNLHDGNVSVALNIPLNKYLSVKPTVQYSFPLSSSAAREIRDGSYGTNNNFVYGGLVFNLAI